MIAPGEVCLTLVSIVTLVAFRVDGGETLKITSLGSCERLICDTIRAHYLRRDEVRSMSWLRLLSTSRETWCVMIILSAIKRS